MSYSRAIGDSGAVALNDAPIGQRQICNGGSIGHGVILRMKTARAWAQGADAGQPPAKQSKMAQSTW
jgi:hypothetical protein